MSQEPIRRYLDTKANLDKAYAEVQQMRALIAEVGQKLLNPYNFMISNVSVGFPAEVAMGGGVPTLNADNWPSAKQIAENLTSLHRVYHEVQNAWMAIPESDRKNLIPPSDMK